MLFLESGRVSLMFLQGFLLGPHLKRHILIPSFKRWPVHRVAHFWLLLGVLIHDLDRCRLLIDLLQRDLLLLHLGLLWITQGPVVLLVGLETRDVALAVVVLML